MRQSVTIARAPEPGLRQHTLARRLPYVLLGLLVGALAAALLMRVQPRVLTIGALIAVTAIFVITLYVWQDYKLKFVLVAPAFFLLLAVSIFPFVYALLTSMHNVSSINLNRTWTFIGLANYQHLLADRLTWQAILVTLEFVVLAVATEFVLGFFLALLFDRVSGILLSFFLMPMMVTPIAAGLIWKYMFNVDNGFFNVVLTQLGLQPVPWLTLNALPGFAALGEIARQANATYAMLANLIVDIWQWTPMMALILYAGLRSLPMELLEAARVDGATTAQLYRFVTLPMLRPVITVAMLVRLIDVVKVYDPVWAMFGNTFRTLNIYLGTFFFRMRDYGGGAALSIVILIIVSIIAPLLFRALYTDTRTS